ncbi:leucine-rich repeat and guanylate kinase domain-containing protein-like [Gigantopelta aegis]|uniref:leucine-rich repeat and guanylate kinase domain-containing protein-like n=1 Tax=Gigantopelta aegis TaxID=1735272 RepID=UPI001B88C568|nr:leucine-rich repeat and guanylate kinase domain-containing protein-like [Gigantopelta aegis]
MGADTDILTLDDKPQTSDELMLEVTDDNIDLSDGSEEEHIELSPGGILDEETISRGLSTLGRSADGVTQVYLHCTIAGFSLKDISILSEYVHLQKVEIPYNELTELSALSTLEHLLILDASHNQITTMLDFKPPKNLQQVDFSYNQIEQMENLSAHHCLKKLDVSHNKITRICGLEQCERLTDLSVAHNRLENIEGLDRLPIQFLNLCYNRIRKIENLENLKYLRQVNLSGNIIRSLQGLEGHDLLEAIDLEDNEVIDMIEIRHIRELRMLRQLNLKRNPIQELPDYRLSILFRVSSLSELDRHRVEAEEKVSAVNLFDPPLEVVAAKDHIMHVVYNFLQPSHVWDSTLPSNDTQYPMLVLAGPQGSGKKDLALKLVEEFSDYFGYGISHTTRCPHMEEVHGKDYNFVSLEQFETDIKMGKFIQTNFYNGHWYGLQMESVESVAREGLACVVHMEIEGVLTLKNTYFEPRYVLLMPLSTEAHEKRLRERGAYTESQIEFTIKRDDVYCEYNQIHPGFFDMMINSDDIQEAYRRLRRLVMDYLGISNLVSSLDGADYQYSEVQAPITDSIADNTAMGSAANPLASRSWSRPSITDTVSQPRGRVGIVEEESIKRRQSAAKGAVNGYIPPLYEQILSQYPKTAPQPVATSPDLRLKSESRPYSVPISHSQPAGLASQHSPDSTSNETCSSSLSDLDSATELQTENVTSNQLETNHNYLPTATVDPLELIDELRYRSMSDKVPSPPTAPRPDSLNRPGSQRHKVLPPIAT